MTLISIIIFSCGNPEIEADEEYIKELVESRLGGTQYYISLPKDYKLEESQGTDFTVYYFQPSDTTVKKFFAGGIYFGAYPSEFKPVDNTCTTEKLSGKLLDIETEWTLHSCNDSYQIQSVVEKAPDLGYIEKVHAFGHGYSRKEINKLLSVFSTLKEKK